MAKIDKGTSKPVEKPVEYSVYARIEAVDGDDNCFEPDEVMTAERTLFVTTDVDKADEFMQSLPYRADEL